MLIISLADNLHEIPSLILAEKYKKKIKFKMSTAAVVISTIRVRWDTAHVQPG